MVLEPPDMIEEGDLTDSDREILDALSDGALTKGAIVDRTGLHRNTVRNRLDVLVAGDTVGVVHEGTKLYELVDDPRDPDITDSDPEVERLRDRVRDLNTQLEATRQGDSDVSTDDLEDTRTFINRALEALPEDVPGRTAAEDAKAVLDQVLEDV